MVDSKKHRVWEAVKVANAFRWVVSCPLLARVGGIMLSLLIAGWAFYKGLPLVIVILLPFAIVLLALVAVLVGHIIWDRTRSVYHIDIGVTATTGFNPQQFLVITNYGGETTFTAECQIQAFNAQSHFPTGKFHLGWGDGNKRSVRIAKHSSERLLIASFNDEIPLVLSEMTIWQVVEGDSRGQHWARWNQEGDDLLPSYLLNILVIAEGAERPWTSNFVLKPQSNLGPLTMECLGVPL